MMKQAPFISTGAHKVDCISVPKPVYNSDGRLQGWISAPGQCSCGRDVKLRTVSRGGDNERTSTRLRY